MNCIDCVPEIIIRQNLTHVKTIATVQEFIETEDRIIVKCAEHVPEFVRGYVCDFSCEFLIKNENFEVVEDKEIVQISNLVLVYINRNCVFGSFPQFEYIFFK